MPRILIIDDEDTIREVLRDALEEEGYRIEEAADGRKGARMFRENPPDLVILDIFMPEKEGLETMLEIRRDFPEFKCIAISGGGRSGTFDYLSYAKVFGAARTFTKPFDLQELLDAVRELVGEGDARP